MRKTAASFLGGILLCLLSACSSNSEQLTSEAAENIVNELNAKVPAVCMHLGKRYQEQIRIYE